MSIEEIIRRIIREELQQLVASTKTKPASKPKLLNVEDVMLALSCSKRYAYEVMEYKDFPLIRIGRLKRVREDEFYNWLSKYKKRSSE
ncbi:DNA-binding protein [Cytobacillus luteolus]|uniref:DNA-binding protein n=1 Tax=Litchfieldia luteola TaxID=682179 RepID=UPI001AE7D2C2|nr:DNA-binding protein [Cytobacillus luteolus]MBP1944650.1 putative DNA-binding transcriptional regulator AlpA [Cytobacillus luteolus]